MVIVLALVGLMVAGPVRAQGLAEALEHAWARHPQASAAPARADEARARIDVAGQPVPGGPTVSLARKSDRLASRAGQQEWELEVSTPMWLPRQRSARLAEGEALAAGVGSRSAALRLQLAAELREAWWAMAAARLAAELAERRVATAQALQADVARRYRAGDLARIDANLAQSELLSAQAELTEARLAVQAAEQDWLRLTGRPGPARIDPQDVEPRPSDPAISDDHPGLIDGRNAVRLARARLALAEQFSREQPQVALRALRERADSSVPYSNQFGFRVSIPFSFDPHVRQETHGAQAELIQAEAELARLHDRLRIELARAGGALDAAERLLAAAGERSALAADNLQLAQKSFSLGESDLATLLRVRAAAFDAEGFLHRQQAQRAFAVSRLRQARGELP